MFPDEKSTKRKANSGGNRKKTGSFTLSEYVIGREIYAEVNRWREDRYMEGLLWLYLPLNPASFYYQGL